MLPVVGRRLREVRTWLLRRRAGLVLLPWLAVAVNALLAKYNQIVMRAVSDSLMGAPPFSLWSHVHQFRYDLLVGFVIVPSIIVLSLRWVGWRWILLLSSVAAMFWQVVMSAETATYAMANNYATFRTMVMAFFWAVKHPKNQFLTLLLYDKIYALGGMALVAMLILLAYAVPMRRKIWWSRAGLAICGLSILTCVPAATAHSDIPVTSIYSDVAASLLEHRDAGLMAKSLPELMADYRQDADLTEAPADPSPYAGKAKGYNVVFVVMESISAEVFDPARDPLDDMPTAKRLRQTAFVGREHFTSYPLTNRASFGIFTSMYTETAVGLPLSTHPVKLPGMIRDLNEAGYNTGYFGYVWRDEEMRDDSMMDALGFDRVVDPLEDAPELPSAELMFGGPVLKAAENDHKALIEMRKSIREWTAKKQRFAAAFFPEMGHDPWRNLTKNEHAGVQEMGHALAVYQDRFLGEIVDELKRDHALDHTIIVVTADHGLRVTADDAGEEVLISRGKVDDRTMRVPLMIYVPKVLTKTTPLAGPTSHIDIEPTILELLGVDDKSGLQQGVAMWSPAIATRRLYLPMKVFGANGYYERGLYYTANQSSVYTAREFPFSSNALPYNGEEAKRARAIVDRHSAMTAAIIDHLLK